MKLSELKNSQIKLFNTFFNIPLDIEGSNLENTGYMPSKEDVKYMGEESYKSAVEEYNTKTAKVLFKNISLQWDSCDCGGEYGCSHSDYVYDIHIIDHDNKKVFEVECEDGDHLCFSGDAKMVQIPVAGASIYDFIRACELCEIELEFTDYAKELFQKQEVKT